MKRGRQERSEQDHSGMAFVIAAVFSLATVAGLEGSFYSDLPFWSTRHIHEPSLLGGTVVFVGLLYFLQYMNDKRYAFKYAEPYIPLLLFSGINVVVKLSVTWFVLVVMVSVSWSIVQARRLSDIKGTPHRASRTG